jgi:hypothetical protein
VAPHLRVLHFAAPRVSRGGAPRPQPETPAGWRASESARSGGLLLSWERGGRVVELAR